MELLPFFLILLATVLFALAFRRFHLPWVLALITAGIIMGPHGLAVSPVTPTLLFFSELGLIFLMFMAGLEVQLTTFKKLRHDIEWLALLNGGLPLIAGIALGLAFNFDLIAALLLGIIFMSSSIAVIIPTLEALHLTERKLGRTIVAATVIVDVISLVLLSVLLQTVDPVTALPLPAFYFILAILLASFAYGLPRLRALIPHRRDAQDLYQSEVRIIFALLIGVVVTFELLGLHPIIASFFAGLVLSESIRSELLLDKLRTIGYGIFIPVFFVVVGMETDISVFLDGLPVIGLIVAVVATSMAAKFGSGWLGGRLLRLSQQDAALIGAASLPQLSTTLAVVYTAVEFGLLPNELVTAMVILSLVTTLVAPIALRALAPAPH